MFYPSEAAEANLLIWDGPSQPSYIPLTPTELRTGSRSYTTINDKVSIRLEVLGALGNAKTDSVVLPSGELNSPAVEAAEYAASTTPRIESDRKLTAGQGADVESPAGLVSTPVQPPSAAPEPSNPRPASPQQAERASVFPTRQASKSRTAPAANSPLSTELSEPTPPSRNEEDTQSFKLAEAIRVQQPKVPPEIKSMIRSDNVVEVQVRVDESGKVIAIMSVSTTGTAAASLVRYALEAAHGWLFKPATQNGKAVRSDKVLQFLFRPSDR